MIDLRPLGDRGFLARFDRGDRARAWASAARRPGLDVVLAYASVAVHADPSTLDMVALEAELRGLAAGPAVDDDRRSHVLPVLYDGVDLGPSATALGLGVEDFIRLHAGIVYDVQAVGFLPGFAYLGDLPTRLRGLPRRAVPRASVPAGSVAIAGRQSCVYPSASPGGWHLVGRTPLRIVEVEAGYFPIRAGDGVHFRRIDARDYADLDGNLLPIDEVGG